jgi:hypothetical protein
MEYFGKSIHIDLGLEATNKISLGFAMFTKAGEQLSHICQPKPMQGFEDYLMSEAWNQTKAHKRQ